jgi:small subunit ribosomal protein S21
MENIVVTVKGGNIEKALRELKRKYTAQGITEELRERSQYTKPSVKRRNVIKSAAYKQKKKSAFDKD